MAYTNATALSAAIALAESANDTELVEKLTKMLTVTTKPRAKSDTGMSANTLKNINHAREVAKIVWDAAPMVVTDADGNSTAEPARFNSVDLVNLYSNPEVMSAQKMCAILKRAAEGGWLSRVLVKNKPMWVAGEVDPRA